MKTSIDLHFWRERESVRERGGEREREGVSCDHDTKLLHKMVTEKDDLVYILWHKNQACIEICGVNVKKPCLITKLVKWIYLIHHNKC